ncbi:MAG TPA: hypothetical protein VHO69_14065 [Phototrophicaceae bacterium]|nr:hypothetical protein [Phototrophicaceae bacterium]
MRTNSIRLLASSLVLLVFSLFPMVTSAQTIVQELDVDYSVRDISWSPDGELLTVSSTDGIYFYTADLQAVSYLPANPVVWSSDSTRLASADGSISIWQRQPDNTFTLERNLTLDGRNPFLVTWSPDGKWLASWDIISDNKNEQALFSQIHIWNTKTWRLESTLQETYYYPLTPPYTPFTLKWSPDSTRIAGIGIDEHLGEIVFISETLTGKRTDTLIPPTSLTSIDWSSTGLIAIGHQTLGIFDTNTDSFLYSLFDVWAVNDLSWSPDGYKLALTNEGVAEIRDYATNQVLAALPDATNYFAWHPDGNKLAAGKMNPETYEWAIQIWDVSALPSVTGIPTLTPYPTRMPTATAP